MKRQLNYDLLLFHVREACQELDSLRLCIKKMLGRIAFKVALEKDSRMIIGSNGDDRLNGKGVFLFRDSTCLHRGQVLYISDEDFESLHPYPGFLQRGRERP